MVAEAKPTFHIAESKEPALAMDIRNPSGDLAHVRVPMVVTVKPDGTLDAAQTAKDTVELFDALLEHVVAAEWPDSARIYRASFDPAVAQAMLDGASIEDALDIKDASAEQANAFKRLGKPSYQGGGYGGGGGRGGGGGGGGKAPLDLDEIDDKVYDDLPKAFTDELRNGKQCPDCRGTKFYDNRDSDRGGPKFACANKNCEGGGKKRDGGYFPWGWFGAKSNDGGGGGSRRRSRGD